jgi:hypothetical protein
VNPAAAFPLLPVWVLLLSGLAACSTAVQNSSQSADAQAHADSICLTSQQLDRDSAQLMADMADAMAAEPGEKDQPTRTAIAGTAIARSRGCVD